MNKVELRMIEKLSQNEQHTRPTNNVRAWRRSETCNASNKMRTKQERPDKSTSKVQAAG